MTPWIKHQAKWRDCRLCDLCEGRRSVVLARGRVPCDVLFVGEAPGVSEDVIGQPFVGPAGKLLDQIIYQAFAGREELTCAWTNLVACFPKEEKSAGINEPPESAIKACAPRLREFIGLCRPRLIVCVGQLATNWVRKTQWECNNLCDIIHPAAILRMNLAQRGLAIQRCVMVLANALEDDMACP